MGVKISDTASSPNYIVFPDGPWDLQASCAMLIHCNVNATIAMNNRLFSKNMSASTVQSWGIACASSQMIGAWYESTVNIPATNVGGNTFGVDGKWKQVLLVFDNGKAMGEKCKVYVNGGLELDFDSISTTPDTTATAFSIGKDQRTGNNGAPIDVAEFEVYRGPVSAAQAVRLWNGGQPLRFQDMGLRSSNYYSLRGDQLATIRDEVGTLHATGSGVTNARRHPDMWYLRNRNRARVGLRGR